MMEAFSWTSFFLLDTACMTFFVVVLLLDSLVFFASHHIHILYQ